MSAYGIVTLTVEDRSWVKAYLAEVGAIVEQYGGRYLAKGGDFELLEGEHRPHTVVLLEFDDFRALHDWYDSDEYRPHRDARVAGSRSSFYLIEGL